MYTSDLIAFGLSSLRRQKLRTALTVLGVTIGTATLVISVAIGLGVRQVIDDQFHKEQELRQITVFPSGDDMPDDNYDGVPADILDIKGSMSSAKSERIRKLRASRWKRQNMPSTPKPLTPERLAILGRISHVVDVSPVLDEYGRAFPIDGPKDTDARIYGVSSSYPRLTRRLEVGQGFSSDDARECLVHEYLLYRCGIRDDADVHAIIGRPLRIEITSARNTSLNILNLFDAERSLSREELEVLDKTWRMLPEFMETIPLPPTEKALLLRALKRKRPGAKEQKEKRISETLTIVGVLRAPMKDDKPEAGMLDRSIQDSDVIVPRGTAERFFIQLPNREENGYSQVRLTVDHEDHIEEVVREIHRLGLHEYSLGMFVHQMKKNSLLIGFAMDFIALIALIVAAIGISNTMFTTVLERTREIGILKAVGARDSKILWIFLIEGSLIGLIGGLGGITAGWLASFPGDVKALQIMESQSHHPLPETVFSYPVWLMIAVPLFAMMLTTLAALLPARRAAHIEPVVALRHE